MNKISICGDFVMNKKPIGVARVAREVIKYLDDIMPPDCKVELAIPESCEYSYHLKNIEIVKLPVEKIKHSWCQTVFAKYVKKNNSIPLIIHSRGLYSYDSYFYIYDLKYVDNPEYYKGFKRKIIRLWNKIGNYLSVRKAKLIFTDSEYQRKRIIDHYKVDPKKVKVTYLGWEHMQEIQPDYNIFEKHGEIKKGKFLLSLGTVAVYKNIKWSIELARRSPEYQFIYVGNIMQKELDEITCGKMPTNAIFLGYISDEEMKALMCKCEAFLYPSLYEGFGLPPLEAIACGTKAVVSTSTCLPEVYCNNVYYIDPYDYEITVDEIFSQSIEDPTELLEKYSWRKTAEQLISQIIENENRLRDK